MRYLGVEGYLRLARSILEARARMVQGIGQIDGLHVIGSPELSILGFSAHELNIWAIAEQMTKKGWFVSTMSDPPGIHLGMLTMAHVEHAEEYLSDLQATVSEVREQKLNVGPREASYGG
jgi:glutamate/tyrosine decarboxylase-like PLP-dependent enzyme